MSAKADIETACIAVLDRFMDALNAYDADGMDACMHFPHVRMAENRVTVYDAPGNNPMDLFDRLKREDGWRRSAWDERRLAQWNEEKAHFALSYTRYREDGSVIGKYESLYILTLKDGSWGVQARSSFGP